MLDRTTTEQLPSSAQRGDEWPMKSPANAANPKLPPGLSWPKISIVTPSFNQGTYLEKTIRSILLQGYPNLEYIIIDGGSTDQSVEVIKKYEQWIDYWVSEKDSGQSNAINKGLAKASGELLGWLNSDDYYLPGALFKLARAYLEDTSVGAIYGQGHVVDETGAIVHIPKLVPVTRESLFGWCFGNDFMQPSCLFTRKAWQESGSIDESLNFSLDVEFWIRIADRFTFKQIPDVLSIALAHPRAKTTSMRDRGQVEFALVCMKHGEEATARRILAQVLSSHFGERDKSGVPGAQYAFSKVRSYWKYARVASRMAGGWFALMSKAVRALRRGGFAAVQQRALVVKSYAEVLGETSASKTPLNMPTTGLPAWMPRLLFIDWSTPRPDKDAGSLTTYHLLKIYVDLGYNVTFIPGDLLFLGEYTAAIRALGVRCLHREDIGSVSHHLQKEGGSYKFVLICRAPTAQSLIADIRQFAPDAKIILNTSDLHYLRDMREAEIAGTVDMIEAAQLAKKQELNVISKCDVIIVMSPVELEILKGELPSADIRRIPLMFVETVHDCPAFGERGDFLFIGGFAHAPNVDAAIYFCNEILPLVLRSLPNIKFHIIGSAPPPQILALANLHGVVVHGQIKDISPMFNSCRLSVAPLRYGAGIKGKIGTSLAYGVPVVATSVAVEGMELEEGEQVLVADIPQQFADAIVRIYTSNELWAKLSLNGRDRMLQHYSHAAGYRRISALMKDINSQHRQIDLYALRSFQEYDLLIRAIREDIRERTAVEHALIEYDQPNFFIKGFCATCGCESMFNTSFTYSFETSVDGKPIPNWREHLDCVKCGFTNRVRAAMHMFYSRVRPSNDAAIYITEQATPLFRWLRERHPGIIGSEYFNDAAPFGSEKGGLRNEDLMAPTFADNSFDSILSFDVMEHVSDDIAALREVYRCLKPGGTFLFAPPFAKDRTEKLIRARKLPDGSVEHIMPPEYHGNPVDPENGALCFHYFAWDLIDDMKVVGFEDPIVLHYWSRDFAYLGGEQFMFIGRKPV